MILKKIYLRFVYLYNYLYFKLSFKQFGWGTIIDKRLFIKQKPSSISIGKHCKFKYGTRLECVPNEGGLFGEIIIKDFVSVETFLHIGAVDKVTIENNVLIASKVFISDHDHLFDRSDIPIRYQGVKSKGPVKIKEGAWIGENVCILSGVTIGKNSIIGANSVVVNDVPDYCVYAGVPAKFIKKINK